MDHVVSYPVVEEPQGQRMSGTFMSRLCPQPSCASFSLSELIPQSLSSRRKAFWSLAPVGLTDFTFLPVGPSTLASLLSLDGLCSPARDLGFQCPLLPPSPPSPFWALSSFRLNFFHVSLILEVLMGKVNTFSV